MVITRFYKQERLEVGIEFLTPTFLGGADQNAELRLPPFRNLLRQWWRVANGTLSTEELRLQEGRLFGTVNEHGPDGKVKAIASQVRVELVDNQQLTISKTSFNIGKSRHPEVSHGQGMDVDNALYLGFGPIRYENHQAILRNYIKPGEIIKLAIMMPENEVGMLVKTMALIHAFGTIGSRSRNGYGSLAVHDLSDYSLPCAVEFSALVNSPKKYPHGLGKDASQILVWDSVVTDWEAAMRLLASTYMNVRLSLNIAPQGLQKRHILGYPVTHHNVQGWGGNNGRMPSQLRLMVKRGTDGKLVARILHLPHSLPKPWDAKFGDEATVWAEIHKYLDTNASGFHRMEVR